MKSILKYLKRTILFCTVLLIFVPTQALAAASDVMADGQLDRDINTKELESFVNKAFQNNMGEYSIPGGVISIVKDGNIILAKGYGYANTDNKTPVDPEHTLFRIGSVTKVFTATVIMQLVEEGRINLNKDVNDYLTDFSIKNKYNSPVTMAELLTHTSGIDSDEIGDISRNESEIKPIIQFLKKRMLPVVREPGSQIQYSNYGMALAACILEDVTDQSCNDYINQNILEPLDMTNTTFALNNSNLAQGYNVINGKRKACNLEGYFKLYPIGGLVSTANDMAKFMIANLNEGEYNGNRILEADTVKTMQSRQAGFDPLLPGTCYGFCEKYIDGVRAVCHSGYSEDGFLTEVCLFPQYDLGIFISINQGSNNSFPQEFASDFVKRYYDNGTTVSPASVEDIDPAIAGTYRFGEYSRSTLTKGDIFGAGEDVKVSINGDGTISLYETDPFTYKKSVTTAVQVSRLVFQKANGDYVVFKADSKGKIRLMAQTSNSWHGTYERISWYDTNSFQNYFFLTLVALALFEIVVWLVFLIRYFRKKRSVLQETTMSQLGKNLAGVGSLLNFMFFAISMMTWGRRLRYGVPLDIVILLCIPIITSIITLALAVIAIRIIRLRKVSVLLRINIVLSCILGCGYMWFYHYWNFLGFKF